MKLLGAFLVVAAMVAGSIAFFSGGRLERSEREDARDADTSVSATAPQAVSRTELPARRSPEGPPRETSAPDAREHDRETPRRNSPAEAVAAAGPRIRPGPGTGNFPPGASASAAKVRKLTPKEREGIRRLIREGKLRPEALEAIEAQGVRETTVAPGYLPIAFSELRGNCPALQESRVSVLLKIDESGRVETAEALDPKAPPAAVSGILNCAFLPHRVEGVAVKVQTVHSPGR